MVHTHAIIKLKEYSKILTQKKYTNTIHPSYWLLYNYYSILQELHLSVKYIIINVFFNVYLAVYTVDHLWRLRDYCFTVSFHKFLREYWDEYVLKPIIDDW